MSCILKVFWIISAHGYKILSGYTPEVDLITVLWKGIPNLMSNLKNNPFFLQKYPYVSIYESWALHGLR